MNTSIAIPSRLGILLAAAISAHVSAGEDKPDLFDRIRTKLDAIRPELIELRHDLHRHPEVSGKEERTSGIVALRLRRLGLDVRTNVGGYGVVGVLRGARPGGVVAYRADMDAVRTSEEDPAPFRSETPGVRHICGHDVHTTVALGTAEALASIQDRLHGTVKFIFQPAEETIQGAKAMIETGVLDSPKPAAIFALHTAPFPVGMIGCPMGMALPGCDIAVIKLRGGGDLKQTANALKQAILSINTVPVGGPANLAKGENPALLKDFIYPQVDVDGMRGDQWVTEVSVRASSDPNYAKAKSMILGAVHTAKTGGVEVDLTYVDRQLPDAINDSRLVQATATVLKRVLGDQRVVMLDASVPYFGEDFAFFQKQIPGALLWLGVSNPERGMVGIPHTREYQADDGAILIGASSMASVLADYLEQHIGSGSTGGGSTDR